jgi:hypothetical protein
MGCITQVWVMMVANGQQGWQTNGGGRCTVMEEDLSVVAGRLEVKLKVWNEIK